MHRHIVQELVRVVLKASLGKPLNFFFGIAPSPYHPEILFHIFLVLFQDKENEVVT
jgi:hypothetical protein